MTVRKGKRKGPNRQHKAERVWSNRETNAARETLNFRGYDWMCHYREVDAETPYIHSLLPQAHLHTNTHSDAASEQITAPCLNPSQGCTWKISVPLAGSQRTENPRAGVSLPRRALNNKQRLFVHERLRQRSYLASEIYGWEIKK